MGTLFYLLPIAGAKGGASGGGNHGKDITNLFVLLVDGILRRGVRYLRRWSTRQPYEAVVIFKGPLVRFLDISPRNCEGRDR